MRHHHRPDCDPFDFEVFIDEVQVGLEVGLTLIQAIRAVRAGRPAITVDGRSTMSPRPRRQGQGRPLELPDPFGRVPSLPKPVDRRRKGTGRRR